MTGDNLCWNQNQLFTLWHWYSDSGKWGFTNRKEHNHEKYKYIHYQSIIFQFETKWFEESGSLLITASMLKFCRPWCSATSPLQTDSNGRISIIHYFKIQFLDTFNLPWKASRATCVRTEWITNTSWLPEDYVQVEICKVTVIFSFWVYLMKKCLGLTTTKILT